MVRPTFLVVEPEPEEALSTRKLVLETAKFNVLTAYSGQESLELLQRFPRIDAVIIHGLINDVACAELIGAAKRANPRIQAIFLSPQYQSACKGADHSVSSHQPEALLEVVRRLFGDPRSLSSSVEQTVLPKHRRRP